MTKKTAVHSLSLCFLIPVVNAELVHADADGLIRRIPPGANCIVYMNVNSLLDSNVGKKENWRSKLADAYEIEPLVVPPNSTRVLMASWLEFTSIEPLWEVSVIDVSKTLSMKRVAKDTGGFTEAIGGKMAARAPMNAYFIRLDKKLLGVVAPADRQFAARWSAMSDTETAMLSPYLQTAVSRIKSDTQYLLALDLQDAVSEKRIRQRLQMEEFDCLAGQSVDERAIGEAIAGVKGLTLTVKAQSEIEGRCQIEFGGPVSPLSSIAKPLLIEFLEKCGTSIPDLGSWKVSAKDSSIIAGGNLSTEALRELFSIVNPPSPSNTDDEESTEDATGGKDATPAAQAAASRRYYRAVAKILDGFGKRVRTANSLSSGATFVARDARRIGQLPLLNVDPDLVQWGAGVSSRLLEVASCFGAGGLQARSRAESIMNPTTSGMRSSELEVRGDPNDAIDRQNAARARRAAVAEEKAHALQLATKILLELEAGSSKVRATMTEKYKVDF